MDLNHLLTGRGYRTVEALNPQLCGTQIELIVTIPGERGAWGFAVPPEARTPYFVTSLRLGKTLVVTHEGSWIGTTDETVVSALKAVRPAYRHLVDARKN